MRRSLTRRRAICAVAAVIVLVAIALGVGLGVGLHNRLASSASPASPAPTCTGDDGNAVQLSQTPPVDSSQQIAEAFLSFAIEFNSFHVFAGMCGEADLAEDLRTTDLC